MTATETMPGDAPAHRMNPGGRRMARTVTALLLAVTAAALGAGVPALAWAGALAGLRGWMPFLTVVVVDGSMVVMSLAAVVRRGRGEPARWMWTVTGFLVAASSAVQAAHAWTTTGATTTTGRVVAVAIGAAPPIVVLISTHAWLDLAVAGAPTKARRAAHAARPSRPTTSLTPAIPAPTATTPAASVPPVTSRAVADRPAPAPRAGRDGMTREDIREAALPLRAQGLSHQAIADRLGVSKTRITRALTSDNAREAVSVAA